MLQTYDTPGSRDDGPARLAMLRARLGQMGLDGFLVPRSDAHMGENVAPRDERLCWLTGFSGSAGLCVVLPDVAGLAIDGRYRVQAAAQAHPDAFVPVHVPPVKLSEWIIQAMPGGGVIGYDPMLHTMAAVERLRDALAPAGISLRALPDTADGGPPENPIDLIRNDLPPPPGGRITPWPDALAGRSSADKRAALAADLLRAGVEAQVLSATDSIAWALNIRGFDLPRMPTVLAFAILHADASLDLFVDPARLDAATIAHLGPQVRPHPPARFADALARLGGPVGLDRDSAPAWVHGALAHPVWVPDPCVLPRACKTQAEINGARAAHLRDGAVMAEFLCWLDRTAPGGTLTEIDVARHLENLRSAAQHFRDLSFDTISAAGPNAALPHYRVSTASNRPLLPPGQPGQVLLVDSGGQYLDGTTDITRTIAIGQPDPEVARLFTLVLRGMIDITLLHWPPGLAGRDLDAFARRALWQAGLDYDHGTGHGVGAYLGVHEGPQRLSRGGEAELHPGMILSNEPGYYREGAFGIRCENLLLVTPPRRLAGAERDMLSFETLTLAPFDRRLILPHLLETAQTDWLNAYHARVLAALGPLVSPLTRDWLETACAPL